VKLILDSYYIIFDHKDYTFPQVPRFSFLFLDVFLYLTLNMAMLSYLLLAGRMAWQLWRWILHYSSIY